MGRFLYFLYYLRFTT